MGLLFSPVTKKNMVDVGKCVCCGLETAIGLTISGTQLVGRFSVNVRTKYAVASSV